MKIMISHHAEQRLKERLGKNFYEALPIVYDAYYKGEGVPKKDFLKIMARDKHYLGKTLKVYKKFIYIFTKIAKKKHLLISVIPQ